MTSKEIAEIKRSLRKDKATMTHLRGCIVSEIGNITDQFDQSMANLTEDETDLFLKTIKKTFRGKPGKQLLDIDFTTESVINGECHKLLMQLRDTELKDDYLAETLYRKIIESEPLSGTDYAIILVMQKYDVPRKNKNDDEEDVSDEVFRYILVSICPLKKTDAALSYQTEEQELHNRHMDQLVKDPVLGFMFPSFADRTTNIHQALMYTKDTCINYNDFTRSVFGVNAPMSAYEQKENLFDTIKAALHKDFDIDMATTVQSCIRDLDTEFKIENGRDSIPLTEDVMEQVLEKCGAEKSQIKEFKAEFKKKFDEPGIEINADVLDVTKPTEIKTEGISIKIAPDHMHKVQTKTVDGIKYLTIKIEDDAEVNGIGVSF